MAVNAVERISWGRSACSSWSAVGDGGCSPLMPADPEFGEWCGESGPRRTPAGKLVAVCWKPRVPGARWWRRWSPAARQAAAFDIRDAEQLLVRAFEESNGETMTAGGLKSKMLALDAWFDEHNYGCRSFRAFLAMLPQRVQIAEAGGPDPHGQAGRRTEETHEDQNPQILTSRFPTGRCLTGLRRSSGSGVSFCSRCRPFAGTSPTDRAPRACSGRRRPARRNAAADVLAVGRSVGAGHWLVGQPGGRTAVQSSPLSRRTSSIRARSA